MAQVTRHDKDKTTEEIADDLDKACKVYVDKRIARQVISHEEVLLIRVLSEELLRWRIL
jgi:hypothetical protein